jgi:hypothetical protein
MIGSLARHRDDIRGEVAVVTGASRGLGLLLASELVGHSCPVVLCARDAAGLERAAERLRPAGGEVMTAPCSGDGHHRRPRPDAHRLACPRGFHFAARRGIQLVRARRQPPGDLHGRRTGSASDHRRHARPPGRNHPHPGGSARCPGCGDLSRADHLCAAPRPAAAAARARWEREGSSARKEPAPSYAQANLRFTDRARPGVSPPVQRRITGWRAAGSGRSFVDVRQRHGRADGNGQFAFGQGSQRLPDGTGQDLVRLKQPGPSRRSRPGIHRHLRTPR